VGSEVPDDEDVVSKDDLEDFLPPRPFAMGSLDGDPDRLMMTKDELIKIQAQLEEFVNGMTKYQVDFADPRWLRTLKREGGVCFAS